MLEFVIRNGKFSLQPVANFDGPETVSGLYTAGNIIEESFALNYFDEQAQAFEPERGTYAFYAGPNAEDLPLQVAVDF